MTPARQAAHTLLKPLDLIGIPAIVLDHGDVAAVLANIELVGRALGEEDRAAALVDGIRSRLDAVAARVGGLPPREVYLERGGNDRGGYLTVREGSYTADMLARAGGLNVFRRARLITQISGEALFRAQPELILVAGSAEAAAALPQRVGWDRLQAVQAGRVAAVPRAELLIPGPRLIDGVERLARLLHPGAFAP
jgi:iron complex transport system substrate-binding protein